MVKIQVELKGILWHKYKSGLKVAVFIDEIDGETHFAQLGPSWPGEPKMSRKILARRSRVGQNEFHQRFGLLKLHILSPTCIFATGSLEGVWVFAH